MKVIDPLVRRVRVANHNGRMRMVLDLTTTDPPAYDLDEPRVVASCCHSARPVPRRRRPGRALKSDAPHGHPGTHLLRLSPPPVGPDEARARAAEFELPFVARIAAGDVEAELLAALPMQFARRNLVLPLARDGDEIVVAIADPRALAPLDDLRVLYGMPIAPVVVPADALTDAINRAYDLALGHRRRPDGQPRGGAPRPDRAPSSRSRATCSTRATRRRSSAW